jgi:phosphoesterase RecJ-like protein
MNETNDLHSVTAWLRESHRPLLLTHRRPDGDALGSLAAMAGALQRLGAEPTVVLFEALPRRYGFLRDAVAWREWDRVRDIVTGDADAVLILDTCSLSQLEPAAAFLATAPRTLVIDHHATRDAIGTRPGDLRCFDETASATSLIVAEWIRAAGLELDGDLATALFTGIATDCGWFRFSNTDARTLRMAADLVQAGVDPASIHRRLYQQDPLAKLRLVAHVLSNVELHADGRLAVMYVRPEDFEATGADESMTEDLVNEATRLAGTEATLLITQEDTNLVRVNFRSKQSLDVAALARRFGGGGHARAAGARLRGPWHEVVPRLIRETIEAL